MTSIITDLQDRIAARLAGLDLFKGPPTVEPLTERASDLFNRLDRTMRKIGLSIFIATPEITGAANRQAIVKPTILVSEMVSVNQSRAGTKVPAADAALQVLAALWWDDPQAGDTQPRVWQPADWWEPIANLGMKLSSLTPIVEYEITGQTAVFIRPKLS